MPQRCLICDSPRIEAIDHRPRVPIAQNLIFRSRDQAVACPVGELSMVRCMACGFGWNAAFDPRLLTYDADYENDQSLSPAFERHLDEVAALIAARMRGGRTVTAVEVGCGQGYFLHRLAEALGDRLETLVGFDPAFRADSPIPPGARVETRCFDEETRHALGVDPDLVVTRHVIEHVPDPLAFLGAIRRSCAPGTPVIVETPTLQWILDGAVAHDLYYEHCSLFDAGSLRLALELAGFAVEAVTPRLDGQYILAVAHAADPGKATAPGGAIDNRDYPARRDRYIDRWRATLARDKAAGHAIALWGGASKGVTLALLLGEDVATLACAIDINPKREGAFMPVTGLPVVSPSQARAAGVTRAYVMNPVYLPEIQRYCREQDWPLELLAVE